MVKISVMKISIITVSYNSSATIKYALQSVRSQAHPFVEHLVIDGGSTDATLSIVDLYRHPNLFLVSESDDGIYDAMNKGLCRATGDVIGFLNSDDFYTSPSVLTDVASVFEAHPEVEVVFGDVDFFYACDMQNSIRKYRVRYFKPWMLLFGFMPPHPAIFIKKGAYERVGLYKSSYKIAADFDLIVRLLLVNKSKYKSTGKCWVRMRMGGASTSNWQSNRTITREIMQSLRENNLFSNALMVLMRLPIKLLLQKLF